MEIMTIIALNNEYQTPDLEAIQGAQRNADLEWMAYFLRLRTEIFVRRDGLKHRQLDLHSYSDIQNAARTITKYST